jgi:hypothetical protein
LHARLPVPDPEVLEHQSVTAGIVAATLLGTATRRRTRRRSGRASDVARREQAESRWPYWSLHGRMLTRDERDGVARFAPPGERVGVVFEPPVGTLGRMRRAITFIVVALVATTACDTDSSSDADEITGTACWIEAIDQCWVYDTESEITQNQIDVACDAYQGSLREACPSDDLHGICHDSTVAVVSQVRFYAPTYGDGASDPAQTCLDEHGGRYEPN